MQLKNGGHWNYTFKPASVPRDGVRAAIGDTIAKDAETLSVSDEEILDCLTLDNNSVLLAAARICDQLSARFAREDSVNISSSGGLNTSNTVAKSPAYAAMAKRLREQATANGEGTTAGGIYAGGISIAERDANRADTDIPQPAFYSGQFENA